MDADRELAALAERAHGVFTSAQAEALGIGASARAYRIRSGRWQALFSGVYRLPGAQLSSRGALLAACRAAGRPSSASHRSAAALWGLPGGATDVQEITCSRWRRARHATLVVHETTLIRAVDLTSVDGIPVTGVARTLLDLGAVCRPIVVEMALDNALRRELVTLPALNQMLRELGRRGRNGTGVLRGLLGERDPTLAPTESEMETRLLAVLRRHGLPAPVPQFVIREGDRFVARVDFAYPSERIAIEYDSFEHHTGHLAHVRDNARRNQLVGLGWPVIVATAEDVRNGGHQLAATIRARFGAEFLHRSA